MGVDAEACCLGETQEDEIGTLYSFVLFQKGGTGKSKGNNRKGSSGFPSSPASLFKAELVSLVLLAFAQFLVIEPQPSPYACQSYVLFFIYSDKNIVTVLHVYMHFLLLVGRVCIWSIM